jgi:hypothetical protein
MTMAVSRFVIEILMERLAQMEQILGVEVVHSQVTLEAKVQNPLVPSAAEARFSLVPDLKDMMVFLRLY